MISSIKSLRGCQRHISHLGCWSNWVVMWYQVRKKKPHTTHWVHPTPFRAIFSLHSQKNKLFLAQECSVLLFPLRGTMSQKINTWSAKLWSLKAGWPSFRPLDADTAGSWGSMAERGEKPALFWHGWAHAIPHIWRLSTGHHKTVFIHRKVAQNLNSWPCMLWLSYWSRQDAIWKIETDN